MNATFTTVRPRTFELVFTCEHADRVISAIRTMDGARASYVAGAEGGVDYTAGNDGKDGFGTVRLIVRAVDQHSAERAARKVLERVDVSVPRTDKILGPEGFWVDVVPEKPRDLETIRRENAEAVERSLAEEARIAALPAEARTILFGSDEEEDI